MATYVTPRQDIQHTDEHGNTVDLVDLGEDHLGHHYGTAHGDGYGNIDYYIRPENATELTLVRPNPHCPSCTCRITAGHNG